MLKPAKMYQTDLERSAIGMAFDDRYKFSRTQCYYNLTVVLADSTWSDIQMVSVCSKSGRLLGFLHAAIHRESNSVSGLTYNGFCSEKIHAEWLYDMREFFESLFTKFNFNKINFSVVIGNPAEKSWDRLCKAYGGRVVGYCAQDIKLTDGKLYDRKLYEVMASDFYATRKTNATR
jgi:hypothetical protein